MRVRMLMVGLVAAVIALTAIAAPANATIRDRIAYKFSTWYPWHGDHYYPDYRVPTRAGRAADGRQHDRIRLGRRQHADHADLPPVHAALSRRFLCRSGSDFYPVPPHGPAARRSSACITFAARGSR